MNNANGANSTTNAASVKKASKSLVQEQQAIDLMIRLYCKGNKHNDEHKSERSCGRENICNTQSLCKDCQDLRDYAIERLARCPVVETRTFCQFCKIHCYRNSMRTKITDVMRYSGPKIIFYKPLYAIRHLLELRKHKKRNSAR
ncbi:MAG: nitrous oxide-stimulated promoter family protein [Coriobacteriales bacterium]|jgi:hypothetical protein|nr:nitrous oxide-stimulated promoter family protein [Coriobacteriales bacterium]